MPTLRKVSEAVAKTTVDADVPGVQPLPSGAEATGDDRQAQHGPATGGREARSGALGALGSTLFTRFWTTICLSLTGVWVRITAMGYLVYEITDDELKLGLISFAQAAPILITGPIAGSLLDRIDRRKILIAVQIVNIVAMSIVAWLVWSDRVEYWHLVLVAITVGSAAGFDWPSRLSMVPLLVKRSQLQSAVALNAAAFNGSRIIGPTIAGWLIGGFGLAACFGFSAAAFIPFTIVLFTLGVATAVKSRPTPGVSAFATLIEGYQYILRTPRIRGLLSVDVVPLALGTTYLTMAPAIARDVLDLGSRGLGLMLAANGVGSLSGTIAVALLSGVRHRGRIVIFGVALFSLFLIAFALSSNTYLSFALMLCLGLCVSTYGTFNDTLVQLETDDVYRGRVLSVYTMLWGLTPIGGLEVGLLSQWIGVQSALAINGLLILGYVLFLWTRTPVRMID